MTQINSKNLCRGRWLQNHQVTNEYIKHQSGPLQRKRQKDIWELYVERLSMSLVNKERQENIYELKPQFGREETVLWKIRMCASK